MRGWIVTGTDTGVGKTVVAAALARLRAGTQRVVYVKPVQSGAADGDDDAADVRLLAGVPAVTGAWLGPSLAPAVACRRAGLELTGAELAAGVRDAVGDEPGTEVVVEGAGGLLVELGTDGTTVADLAAMLELPVVVTTRAGLGTLNHTGLTLEALHRRGRELAGVVVCGVPVAPDLAVRTNGAELHELSAGRLVGAVPVLEAVTPGALDDAARWFAPSLGGSWDVARWLAALDGAQP